MTLSNLFVWLAALWWAAAVLLLLASFAAALVFPHLPWQRPGTQSLRPLTAIVPVKYWTDHFEQDQETLFAQDYPELEIIVTAAEAQSQALDAIRKPASAEISDAWLPRIVQSGMAHAASPKLNSMWPGIEAAWHDLILIKDSNIRLAAGDVENLVHHHGPGVGLVSTITITTDPQSLGAWIESSIVNCYHARVLMLASALGIGAGCGKIMLFSRAALEKAGGLDSLAWAIGEDEAMQQAFAAIGLRTVLSDRISRQLLGVRSLHDVWQRQLRWMLIWRLQTPGVFVGDFLASALPVSLAALVAAPLVGLTPLTARRRLWASGSCWNRCFVFARAGLCPLWSPPAFLGREILGPGGACAGPDHARNHLGRRACIRVNAKVRRDRSVIAALNGLLAVSLAMRRPDRSGISQPAAAVSVAAAEKPRPRRLARRTTPCRWCWCNSPFSTSPIW